MSEVIESGEEFKDPEEAQGTIGHPKTDEEIEAGQDADMASTSPINRDKSLADQAEEDATEPVEEDEDKE